MKIELLPGDASWKLVEPLEALHYTPEVLKTWVGRDVTWAHADMRALVRTDEGVLISHAGAFVREGEWDGLPVTLGGIGGVVTHPEYRRQGYAREALKRALTWLHDEPKVAFAVLFTEPHNVQYYANQGWQGFAGPVVVTQPGSTAPFTKFLAMTLGIRQRAAVKGKLDLLGEPW
jgi:aminoglycoside 2'-N-acetyltransferase I